MVKYVENAIPEGAVQVAGGKRPSPAPPTGPTVNCARCGAAVPEAAGTCPNCGAILMHISAAGEYAPRSRAGQASGSLPASSPGSPPAGPPPAAAVPLSPEKAKRRSQRLQLGGACLVLGLLILLLLGGGRIGFYQILMATPALVVGFVYLLLGLADTG